MNAQHLSEVLHMIISNENCEKKPLFFSIFMLLNLSKTLAINNVLKSSNEFRSTFPLNKTIELCTAYYQKNYFRLFRLYKELPLICQLAFHRRLPIIEL